MIEHNPNVGILGTHVGLSLSPVMHNAAYEAMGLPDYHYGTFTVANPRPEDLQAFFETFLAEQVEAGVTGMSVTMPFKEHVLAVKGLALSKAVREIGAANTLSYKENQWHAENTDWQGAVLSLEEAGVRIAGKKLLFLVLVAQPGVLFMVYVRAVLQG
ncbi:hypothetical protein IPL68_01405 [Candidatus Saccharibacteria bacterium]|nr:MAG: hypothetical protein IPL68_01405 [Candidatus Saccharibacteria bacterium]